MPTKTREKITAILVSEQKRLNFLPDFFGEKHMIHGERLVYSWARRLSSGYNGGSWNFYRLSNGSGYVAPDMPEHFRIEVTGNGFEGEASADAFGVIVTMFALNKLMFDIAGRGGECDNLIDSYYALREFACEHDEAVTILRAID